MDMNSNSISQALFSKIHSDQDRDRNNGRLAHHVFKGGVYSVLGSPGSNHMFAEMSDHSSDEEFEEIEDLFELFELFEQLEEFGQLQAVDQRAVDLRAEF